MLVSLVPISLFAGRDARGEGPYHYPRFDLSGVGPRRALLTARPLLAGLRALSVALFLLVVLSGLSGEQSINYNLAPTFVWIVWWVGLGFFTVFVGNVWPLLSPWTVLFDRADGLAPG